MKSEVKFSTLGCRLNSYETEAMRHLADTAEINEAVVINTCAVTQQAVSKSRQEIRRLRRENPKSTLIVTGCAAQIDPNSFSKMGEVDFVLGNSEKMRPEIWSNLSSGLSPESERGSGRRYNVSFGNCEPFNRRLWNSKSRICSNPKWM